MEYKKIHACPNDCILYRKEFEWLKNCPKCELSRYKMKYTNEDNSHEMTKDSPLERLFDYSNAQAFVYKLK